MTKEQDKQIAEQVMGWKYLSASQGGLYGDGEDFRTLNEFHPTTDANDDHIVLKHIRENWDDKQIVKWTMQLIIAQIERTKEDYSPINYEPGDYSKAALKVIDERTKIKSK